MSWLSDLLGFTKLLSSMEKRIMATLQEVQDKIAAVSADIVAEKAEVQALLNGLKAQVQALTDQINAGTVVTAADLQSLVASLDAMDAAVKGISEP